MQALILAAGYATRLYPLTKDQPKALLPIGGKTMLDYLMQGIYDTGLVKGAHIVTNEKFYPHFCRWAETADYPGMPIYVYNDGTHEDGEKLGAVGDIAFGIEKAGLDDDLLVAASDNFFTFSLDGFFRQFLDTGHDTLLGQRMADRTLLRRFAVATLDENSCVTTLVEKPQEPESDIGIYALYLYRRDTLPMIGQYLSEGNPPDAPGHFPEWLYKKRKVGVYLFDGECVDIGTPESYREVCERFSKEREA